MENVDEPVLYLPDDLTFKAIVAMDKNRVIGNNGTIPWHISDDLKYFSHMTSGHTVLMGRKTYDSLPEKYRPLPGRLNVVLSRSEDLKYPSEVSVFASVPLFFDQILNSGIDLPSNEVWIIGGAEIYRQFIPLCSEIHLTRVKGDYEGDTILDNFEDDFTLSSSTDGEKCSWEVYER
jgi:dihydrofolate reductase